MKSSVGEEEMGFVGARLKPERDQRTINELLRLVMQIEYAMEHSGSTGMHDAKDRVDAIVGRAPDEAIAKLAGAIAKEVVRIYPIQDARTGYLFRGMLWRLRLALEASRWESDETYRAAYSPAPLPH